MKDAARRLLMVAGWTAALPLLGYSIFSFLTIFPLLGLFFGVYLLGFIYFMGAVPALVTAAGFEFVLRHWARGRSFLATTALGIAATFAWVGGWGLLPNLNLTRAQDLYLIFAFMMAGAVPAALMPLTRSADDRPA